MLRTKIFLTLVTLFLLGISSAVLPTVSGSSKAASKLPDGVAYVGIQSDPVGIVFNNLTSPGSNYPEPQVVVTNNPTTSHYVSYSVAQACCTFDSNHYAINPPSCQLGQTNPAIGPLSFDVFLPLPCNNQIVVTNYTDNWYEGSAITVPPGCGPTCPALNQIALGYDPADQEIYAAANGTVYVYLDNPNNAGGGRNSQLPTLSAVIQIARPSCTASICYSHDQNWAMAYDGANQEMYITNYNASNNANFVSVIDSQDNTLVKNIPVGSLPKGIAYDSATREVYVTNYNSGSVSIIDSVSNTVVRTWTGFTTPWGITYDSDDGYLYIAEYSANDVALVGGQSNPETIMGHVYAVDKPTNLVFGWGTGEVFVANSGASTLTAIGSTSFSIDSQNSVYNKGSSPQFLAADIQPSTGDSVLAATYKLSNGFQLGLFNPVKIYQPEGLAVDTSRVDICVSNCGGSYPDYAFVHLIFVASSSSSSVAVYDDDVVSLQANLTVGANPYGVAYDPNNFEVYVTCSGSNSVYALNVSNIVYTVKVGIAAVISNFNHPTGIAFDPVNNYVYVSNTGNGTVSAINGTNNKIVGKPLSLSKSSTPEGIAYDPTDNDMFVADSSSSSIWAINSQENAVVAQISGVRLGSASGIAANPVNGYIYVSNYASNYILAIGPAAERTVATIIVGPNPLGLVFFPTSNGIGPNEMLVAVSGSNALVATEN